MPLQQSSHARLAVYLCLILNMADQGAVRWRTDLAARKTPVKLPVRWCELGIPAQIKAGRTRILFILRFTSLEEDFDAIQRCDGGLCRAACDAACPLAVSSSSHAVRMDTPARPDSSMSPSCPPSCRAVQPMSIQSSRG